jgi:RNA polymerase sigma-70 factor (ECF subfamily)
MLLPHLDAAYGYARYLARNDAAAEDIVQDAFLRALKAIDQCRGAPRAWLLTIVRNCFLDWTRTIGGQAPISDLPEPTDPETPDLVLERSNMAATVREVIECLPEPFRSTIVLRELEELSYREIADVTGAPIGTVMSRLARARQMLAAMLLDGEPARREKSA